MIQMVSIICAYKSIGKYQLAVKRITEKISEDVIHITINGVDDFGDFISLIEKRMKVYIKLRYKIVTWFKRLLGKNRQFIPTFIIHNVDKLRITDQKTFICIEHSNANFILFANDLSRLVDYIRNRCIFTSDTFYENFEALEVFK